MRPINAEPHLASWLRVRAVRTIAAISIGGLVIGLTQVATRTSSAASVPLATVEAFNLAAMNNRSGSVSRAANERVLTPQALSVGVFRHQELQLADDLGMVPERQIGVHPMLERAEPQLFETRDLGLGEGLVGEVGERWAAPQAQCAVEVLTRRPGVAGGKRAPSLAHECLEPHAVEPLRLDPQLIARRPCDDRPVAGARGVTGAERLSQAGDRNLERPDRLRTAVATPQQRPLLRAPQHERPAAFDRLDRAEDVEVHGSSPWGEPNTLNGSVSAL